MPGTPPELTCTPFSALKPLAQGLSVLFKERQQIFIEVFCRSCRGHCTCQDEASLAPALVGTLIEHMDGRHRELGGVHGPRRRVSGNLLWTADHEFLEETPMPAPFSLIKGKEPKRNKYNKGDLS